MVILVCVVIFAELNATHENMLKKLNVLMDIVKRGLAVMYAELKNYICKALALMKKKHTKNTVKF